MMFQYVTNNLTFQALYLPVHLHGVHAFLRRGAVVTALALHFIRPIFLCLIV